jgi:hypothetical protein
MPHLRVHPRSGIPRAEAHGTHSRFLKDGSIAEQNVLVSRVPAAGETLMLVDMNDWRPFAVSAVWLYAFSGPTEDVVAVVAVGGARGAFGKLFRAASGPAVQTKQAAPKRASGAKAAPKAPTRKR